MMACLSFDFPFLNTVHFMPLCFESTSVHGPGVKRSIIVPFTPVNKNKRAGYECSCLSFHFLFNLFILGYDSLILCQCWFCNMVLIYFLWPWSAQAIMNTCMSVCIFVCMCFSTQFPAAASVCVAKLDLHVKTHIYWLFISAFCLQGPRCWFLSSPADSPLLHAHIYTHSARSPHSLSLRAGVMQCHAGWVSLSWGSPGGKPDRREVAEWVKKTTTEKQKERCLE